jgi:hypothetical protein
VDTCGKLRHDLLICQAIETLVGVELAHRPGWARNAETIRLETLRGQLHAAVGELVEEIETEDCGADEAPAL